MINQRSAYLQKILYPKLDLYQFGKTKASPRFFYASLIATIAIALTCFCSLFKVESKLSAKTMKSEPKG